MKAWIGVALLSSGCLWQGIVERDEHFSFDQSFDRLEFTSWGGDVSLAFGDTDTFEADLHYRFERVEPHVTWVMEDGVLTGEVNCEVLDGRCAVDMVVVSPVTTSAVVYVHRGSFDVSGAQGDSTLEVRFGDATLHDMAGDLDVTVHQGDLIASGLGGSQILLETLDGGLVAEHTSVFDLVRAYVDGGDLDLTVPPGTYNLITGATVGGAEVDNSIVSDTTAASRVEIRNLSGMSWVRAGSGE
jgi:hypothetical protein